MLRKFLEDLLVLLGCISISVGCYMIYPPLSPIVAGLFLCAWGILYGRFQANQQPDDEPAQEVEE
jgi:hypothetical protein